MSARLRRHFAHHGVAYVALFIALGGTSYAATQITGAQVQDGTLTGADFADRSIGARQLAPQARASAGRRGPRGLRGPRGYRGPQGPAGTPGAPGASGISQLAPVSAISPSQSGASYTQVAVCPPGKRLVSGASATNATTGVYVSASGPLTDGREGWQVTMVEDGLGYAGDWTVTAIAYCAVVA